MNLSIPSPLPVFMDRSGYPITGGYVYIGSANQNPITNPVTVYWDEACTIPAAQPIRTNGGYLWRNGTPANVFTTEEAISILLQDSNGTLVYSVADVPSVAEFYDLLILIQNGTLTTLSSVAGTNTITATAADPMSAYSNTQTFRLTPANTNTGATTLNINSLGAKNVYANGVACSGGELQQGVPALVAYDGTQFNIVGITPAASTTFAGRVALATQAQQEAATDTTVAVTPGRQQLHPSAAKAWLYVDTNASISASYNVTSATDIGTGQVRANWTITFSSTNYETNVSVRTDSPLIATVNNGTGLATGSCVYNCFNTSGSLTDPNFWMISAYGDQ